jgi:hypothetical protein
MVSLAAAVEPSYRRYAVRCVKTQKFIKVSPSHQTLRVCPRQRGDMQIPLLETLICYAFCHTFNQINTGRCGRAAQTKPLEFSG